MLSRQDKIKYLELLLNCITVDRCVKLILMNFLWYFKISSGHKKLKAFVSAAYMTCECAPKFIAYERRPILIDN